MNIIHTKSFQLAINAAGNPDTQKVAILLPGRLDTKDYINFIKHLNFLAQKGFYAVSFDYPGTWESPGDVEYTTTNYIKVVNELIEYFGNRPTLLFGHSRGGAVATVVGTANPNVVGIILVNGAYGPPSPPDPAKVKNGFFPEHRDLPPGDKITDEQIKFQLSLDYFTDGEKYNPAEILKSCTKPKLIIHATHDEWESLERVKNIFNTLPEPKMFYELSGKHDYRRNAERIDEVEKVMGEFIDTHNI